MCFHDAHWTLDKSGAMFECHRIANQVHPFMAAVYGSVNGFLQQDNAPCHKARRVQEWFHTHDSELNLLQCPVQSLDLNPIAHLWDEIKRAVWSKNPLPANLTHPWEALELTWGKHPCGTLSTPSGVRAVQLF